MAILNLDKIWSLFIDSKEDKDERVQKGFFINKHLWMLFEIHCTTINKKPLQEIEGLIENYLAKELAVKNKEINKGM